MHERRIRAEAIPRHVAVIMDGNGRWAERRGLDRVQGHRAGIEAVRATVRAAHELGVRFLTLYAFSTENWSRPKGEVDALMGLLEHYLEAELEELDRNGIRLRAIGRLDRLPELARAKLDEALAALKQLENDGDLPADDRARSEKKVQSLTDDFVKQVDGQADQKEQEILQV